MSRSYAITFENATISAAITLVGARPPSDRGLRVIRAWCGQNGTATSKNFAIALGTKISVFQTLTAFTPLPLRELDGASAVAGGTGLAAGTAGILASAEGAGTFTPKIADCFNNLNGFLWVPGPDEVFEAKAGSNDALCMKLLQAPAGGDTTGWYGGMIIMEV